MKNIKKQEKKEKKIKNDKLVDEFAERLAEVFIEQIEYEKAEKTKRK